MTDIVLPFPPSTLSGHAKGHWRSKANLTAKWRSDARIATLAAIGCGMREPRGHVDIPILVTFYPPDRRSDRVNFPNRCKPLFDGIADGLRVNDKRFVPTFQFAEPSRDPRVVFSLVGNDGLN